MPALPVIADTYRCTYEYKGDDATFVNVFGIHSVGSDAQQVADGVKRAVLSATSSSSIQSLQSQDITLVKTTALPLDGVSLHAESAFAPATFGLGAAGAVGANSAGIITLTSAARGRSHRGRIFLGGLPKAFLALGGARFSTSWVTDANSWFATFITNLGTTTIPLELQVISLKLGVRVPVSGFIPRAYIGSIRRRAERQE
jgi:hypothetical protein